MNLFQKIGGNWIISLILAIPVFFLIPYPSRYKASIVLTKKIGRESFVYNDIDSDGNSEKIKFPVYTQLKNVPGIIVEKDEKFHYQWIISGKPLNGTSFHIGDYDNDQMKEIYLFTTENDSLFISGIEVSSETVIYKRKFLTAFVRYNNNVELTINESLMADMNGDGFQELVLFLYSGFSYTNRKIVACDIKNDSLFFSPKSGSVISNNISVFDWDQDSLPEFTGWVPSWGNCTEKNYPYTDSLAWLMVIDNDLSFLFDPVPVGEFSSEVDVVPYVCGDRKFLAVLYHCRGLNDTSFLALYSPQGKLVRKKNITNFSPYKTPRLLPDPVNKFKNLFILNSQIEQWDSTLERIKIIDNVTAAVKDGNYDLDGDGTKEQLFFNEKTNQIIIFRKGLQYPAFINIQDIQGVQSVSVINKQGSDTKLSVFQPPYEYIIAYGRNPLYHLIWVIYAAIYSGILLIVILIGKIQEYRIRQHYNNEKRIAGLQLKAMKNQIDPHFTMNMVNTIGSLFARKQNDKAYKVFTEYSKLLQRIITSSESISITLSEELDYVENYLSIQKFRMDDKFNYSFKMDSKVDTGKIHIPKMMIHTFAENSVKHGISHIEGKGFIEIEVSLRARDLMISVTDNGIGRKRSGEFQTFGAGRGLKILDEIIELFYKIEGIKIRYELDDKTDDSGKFYGTVAAISIPRS